MIIRRNGSLLTATALDPNNVWSGSAFEYLRGPSFLSIGIITPGTAGGLLAAQYVGSALIAEEHEVPFSAPTVWGSNQPDLSAQMYMQAAGIGGDRVVTTLRNPTAGTLTYTALLIMQPASGNGRRGR
jgi:hypothetical protein